MGALTDFFVASPDELAAVLPGWLLVADEPSTREVQNPFTGQKQIATYWPPAIDPPQNIDRESRSPDYKHLSHVEFKRIDHVKLAQLNAILAGGEFLDKMNQFNRPALIDPAQTDETGLHRLDDEFVAALAAINEPKTTAEQWAATEEMQLDQFTVDDCDSVLRELNRLAQDANTSGKGLYFWWSL